MLVAESSTKEAKGLSPRCLSSELTWKRARNNPKKSLDNRRLLCYFVAAFVAQTAANNPRNQIA